jgi:hypothetical protein
MKEIYLTQEGNEEIEAKIAQLEEYMDSDKCNDSRNWSFISGRRFTLEEILNSAIILPVEESWEQMIHKSQQGDDVELDREKLYPNGVVIKQNQ